MKYNLNVVKEVSVTDSFLALDKKISGCQKESFNDCTTRKYMNTLLSKCQCLPFQLRLTEKVDMLNIWHSKINLCIKMLKHPLCTAKKLDCVSSIRMDNSECFQQCSGILITSFDQIEIMDRLSNELAKLERLVNYLRESIPYYLENIKNEFQGSYFTYTFFPLILDNHLGFNQKSDIKDKIKKLSQEYWYYKGFYQFPDKFKGFF